MAQGTLTDLKVTLMRFIKSAIANFAINNIYFISDNDKPFKKCVLLLSFATR